MQSFAIIGQGPRGSGDTGVTHTDGQTCWVTLYLLPFAKEVIVRTTIFPR